MLACVFLLFLCACVVDVRLQGLGSGDGGNLRVCVVEGRGSYKRAAKFCPILDEEKSGVECVIGTDRLDCLRRMGKGTVDFGVFNPEDLIAAQWANIDVLVTNELKNRPGNFERSIVAVINRRILTGQDTATVHSILRNTSLCHQGHGGDDNRGLSDMLTEYLESLVTERSCDVTMSLTENRIEAMASFFGKACKAGPWLPDADRDQELKHKYPSLCASCHSRLCSDGDAYWGAAGALACLAGGAGDASWAQLHDVEGYFGLLPDTPSYASVDQFAYLCRDGTIQTLKDNREPCVWLNRPWPVVIAKRKAAESVSKLAYSLTNDSVIVDTHWRGALAALLETNQGLSPPLSPQKSPLDYLSMARGFREAYSQSGCNPPRHINLCTTSLLEKNKCEWLSESGNVYGVQPPLQCMLRNSKEDCFTAVEAGECDATLADSDWLVRAQRKYKISPLLHEITPIVDQTSTVVAYTRKDAAITTTDQLRGKRASFPRFDGLAWHTVSQYLSNRTNKACDQIIPEYFSEICAPGIEKEKNLTQDVIERFTRTCFKENDVVLDGEVQALRSLVEGKSDVAFLSLRTFKLYTSKLIHEPWANKLQEIVPVCAHNNERYCFMSWASIGHLYARRDVQPLRRHEIINVFTKLDSLFGKYYPFHIAMFSMYGPFNHQHDILFHNNTRTLSTNSILKTHPYDKIPLNFESSLQISSCQFDEFKASFGVNLQPSVFALIVCLVYYVLCS